jgi:putative Holliday junction resolvase
MGKVIALDFGTKRTGVAISDDSKTFAFPHSTIETKHIINNIESILKKESIELFVIGYPKKLDNTDFPITKEIVLLKENITKKFSLDVVLIDERYTSKMASSVISKSGLPKNKRQNKALIDKISATIILQDYFKSLSESN